MNLAIAGLMKRVEKVVVDNSTGILTGVGVVGTVATAYLSGKAALKANEILKTYAADAEFYEFEVKTTEQFKKVWTVYIPPAASGAATIAAIICANRIGTRRTAALAAAYALESKRFEEYRRKMTDKLGVTKEKAVQDELAQDRVNANPPVSGQVIITGNGTVLCYDVPTERYFRSNVDELNRKVNELNQHVIHNGWASLSDWQQMLDIPQTPLADEVGWTQDQLLQISISAVMAPETQEPCISFDYQWTNIRGYK